MGHEIWEYIWAVVDRFSFLFGGVILLVVEFLKRTRFKEWAERLRWQFWAVSALCVLIATFQAWHEQKEKLKESAVYLRPAAIAPVQKPTSPDIFPVGQPLYVNFAWTVFGQKPAKNAFQDGKVYLENDTTSPTQQRVVKDFQIKWEELVHRVEGKEHSIIFPGEKAEIFGGTYQGPVISEPDKLDIKFGRKFVFVIGAARFTDSLGEHEAHLCRWLETHADGPYGSLAWHECDLWISPIDIEK